jgi:2-amino-4-hydroxy-6-hydroxymethyldihydropteridine diphosphokinase
LCGSRGGFNQGRTPGGKIKTVYLGLGSNKGDRIINLRKAVNIISAEDELLAASSVYETLPFGNVKQPDFLNAVISVSTTKDIIKFFYHIKNTEKLTGRTPSEKWGEREIDIDILFFGNEIVDDDILTIPHKGIAERDFVLKPLSEIAPYLVHPLYNKTVTELLKEVTENNIIRIFPEKII